MRTLVIDCATTACSVALFEDVGAGCRRLAHDFRLLGRGHAEQLVPMIAALPDRGRAARIAVSMGPGSFTGVRVGLAAAKALAYAWESRLVGYPRSIWSRRWRGPGRKHWFRQTAHSAWR